MTTSTKTQKASSTAKRGLRPSTPEGDRQTRPKMTAEQQKEATAKITNLYVTEKKPIRAIAAKLGHSYGTVHRLLVAAGVPRRPSGSHLLRRRTAVADTPEADPSTGPQQ